MALKHLPASLEAFERICKDASLKVTHQRLEIYRELLNATDHPSAETLYHRLEERLPSLSLDTVYRTLATFEDLHLVHRVEIAANQARFEALTSRHHHFLCAGCGKILDFFWPEFDTLPLPPDIHAQGVTERAQVIVHGVCSTCRQADDKANSTD